MASLSGELNENDVLLVKVAAESYAESLVRAIRELGERGGRVCVVLLSRPYSAVAKKLGPGKFFFISIGSIQKGSGIGVESLAELSELGMAFSTALKEGCSASLMESVSLLFAYSDYNTAMRFLFDTVSKARSSGVKVVFLLSGEDEHAKELYPLIDKIIALS